MGDVMFKFAQTQNVIQLLDNTTPGAGDEKFKTLVLGVFSVFKPFGFSFKLFIKSEMMLFW